MNEIATRYLAAWNTTDPVARRAAVAALFTPGAAYTDPLMAVRGHDAIDAGIAAAQAQFPGWEFRLAGEVDGHHDQVRFTWGLGPAGAAPVVLGFDVAVLDEGRISAVYGFLDQVPA